MTLTRLRWLAVVLAAAFLVVVGVLREMLAATLLQSWTTSTLFAAIALGGAVLLVAALFRAVERVASGSDQRNRELIALHRASLAVARHLQLDTVLQEVVDQARELVGARYGALSILREGAGIESFLTSGLEPGERQRIGALPEGRGLLGVVLREGQRLRLRDIARDPRSAGFPPNHPPMHSLLAVPILVEERVLGNLYLTEKGGAPEFSPEDEETLARFATQAAVAIENARLHRRVQSVAITEERERIARELHDTLAQVLGYVNTKAQAAQELLERGQGEAAARQIRELAEAARAAYADVREGILGLRTSLGPGRTAADALAEYLGQWQEQAGVRVDLEAPSPDGLLRQLPPEAEVQLLRIVQEALSNVRKHALATHASVRLLEVDGAVQVEVADDGVGFERSALGPGGMPRFGLATMQERAEAVGGRLTIESALGQGTRVVAWLPCPSPGGERSI